MLEIRKTQYVPCADDHSGSGSGALDPNNPGEASKDHGALCPIDAGTKQAYHVDLLIDYLRGDRTWEDSADVSFGGQTYFGFRNRKGVGNNKDFHPTNPEMFFLGDIVNSAPYVQGNNPFNDAGYGGFNCGSDGAADKTADPACGKLKAFFSAEHVNSYRKRVDERDERAANEATRLDKTTVFVGANDGMLHAFDARDGRELFAYIPAGVHGKLKQLADPEYNQKHTYLVDGSPFVSDVLLNGEWRAVLVGNTGRGGRSFFALDVENPESFSEENVLWEITGNDEPDLGYPANGEGVITPIEGLFGKWGVLFGNGYNSKNHDACLFAVELRKSPEVRKICVGTGSAGEPNGLGVPIWVDTDHDGTADIAYAGDALGNLWKFDLRTMSVGNGGYPLLKAAAPDGGTQPITAPPLPIVLKGNGSYSTLQLVAGTGKYFEQKDISNPVVQSIYGVRDLSPSAESGTASRSNLMARSYVTSHPEKDIFYKEDPEKRNKVTSESYRAWKIKTDDPDSPDYGASQMGYVIDFNAPRMENWLVWSQGTNIGGKRNIGIVPTVLPEEDPCASAQEGGLAEINLETGAWVKSVMYRKIEHESNIFIADGSYGAEINRDGKYVLSDIAKESSGAKQWGTGAGYYNQHGGHRGVVLGLDPHRHSVDCVVDSGGKKGRVLHIPGFSGELPVTDPVCGDRVGRQSWRQIR
jgi:hypothetical protein